MKKETCAKYLKVKDVMAMYEISRQTLYRYRLEGLVSSIQLGKVMVRFDREILNKEMEILKGRQTA